MYVHLYEITGLIDTFNAPVEEEPGKDDGLFSLAI